MRDDDKRAQQLGMSVSTATQRLRKMLLFSAIQSLGGNWCFRCGFEIENIDDFSIDHKTPWLYSEDPIQLFFDLDNIAYSHSSCNYSHRRTPFSTRSKTGFKGVYEDPRRTSPKLYKAQISFKRKSIFLGFYEDPVEAAKIYDEKAKLLYGENAVTNESLGFFQTQNDNS